MENLIYQILNGVQIGSIYALVALGYSMVYGIVLLINFAHGEIIMIGSYAVCVLISSGMPSWASIVLAIVICAISGVLIETVAYRPLRSSPRISLLITAIGISLLLQNVAQLIFSANPRMFRNLFPGVISIGEFEISRVAAVTILTSVFFMIVITLVVKKTKIGRAMRAVSQDRETATLMGVNVNTTISFTFAIGSALAAVAAVLYCSAYLKVEPTMGSMLGLKAFVAAVLGGIGSIPGAVLGGFLIGIFESLTKGYISSTLSDAVVFSILIIVLLVKPAGILGRAQKDKV